MNKEQLYAAQTAMIEWLSDPHELGKKPFKIECAGEFDFNEMHYYIFKFKASLLGKWLVGVCGGFEDDDLEPCGHIFSNMQEYNETTAKNECITMVENIMAYWKEQAAKYNNRQIVKHWFQEWNTRGKVVAWEIKQFFHKGNQTIVEWYFKNEMNNGSIEEFDGISLVEWTKDNKIKSLKEFGCNLNNYNPYEHSDLPEFRDERASWF